MSLADCLKAVCNGRSDCVAFPTNWFYQLDWVKPYNLDLIVVPAAVIRPDNAEDVAGAVKCAAKHDRAVQAKSGGHSYANFGTGGEDGAVMVDLVNLQDFKMDEDTWEASFGSGFRLGELDEYLHENGGRAMAHGTCPSVGIGGHATIGGLGPMSRMWGSALDHVEEVEVVTANGEIVRANYTENADLFFGIKGAGSNFGIVTEFKVHTHPEPGKVVEYTYSISFGSPEEMADVFEDWQALAGDPDLDRRFSTLFIVHPLGALVTGTFYGTAEEYEETGIAGRLPGGGDVNFQLVGWMASLAHQAELGGLQIAHTPTAFTSRSLAFKESDLLNNDAIGDIFKYIEDADKGTLAWAIMWNSEGGAMGDFMEGNSYPHRDKVIMYQSYVVGFPSVTSTTHGFVDGLQERIQEGAPNANSTYAGYIDPTLTREEAKEFYWGQHLTRLREIKAKWDPKNVFRSPQSIEPAG